MKRGDRCLHRCRKCGHEVQLRYGPAYDCLQPGDGPRGKCNGLLVPPDDGKLK